MLLLHLNELAYFIGMFFVFWISTYHRINGEIHEQIKCWLAEFYVQIHSTGCLNYLHFYLHLYIHLSVSIMLLISHWLTTPGNTNNQRSIKVNSIDVLIHIFRSILLIKLRPNWSYSWVHWFDNFSIHNYSQCNLSFYSVIYGTNRGKFYNYTFSTNTSIPKLFHIDL